MDELGTLWRQRHEITLEAQRCDATSRFMLFAIPLYIFFPALLLAVVPVFILVRRQRYLCDLRLEKLREKACKELTGIPMEDISTGDYSRWVVDPFSRRSQRRK